MYHTLHATNIAWRLILSNLMTKHDIDNKIDIAHQEINRNLRW